MIPVSPDDVREVLQKDRNDDQRDAISSSARRLLVVAGAGSGKTDVIARRISWWLGIGDSTGEPVAKESVVAFTFGESAAEEMKFRVRRWVDETTPEDRDPTLGGMYVGTIHSFCMQALRDLVPDRYQNYEVIDDAARVALIQRRGAFYNLLGLGALSDELDEGEYGTISQFLKGYDMLNEYGLLDVELPPESPPTSFDAAQEKAWCKEARLRTENIESDIPEAFARSAARFYAYLHCRRFLDFSTSQLELLRLFERDPEALPTLRERFRHVVVDEVQDINEIQYRIIDRLVGDEGHLTAVGDHRQAIYGWRGSKVELMARWHDRFDDDPESEIVRLRENYRSTPRILDLANRWAETIDPAGGMPQPPMKHGLGRREDFHSSHVGVGRFETTRQEAEWIADRIDELVDSGRDLGAAHDEDQGERGLTYGDIGILLRNTKDARTYADVLRERDIPTVFKAGPDLFSQPEVLMAMGVLGRMAGLDGFYGAEHDRKSLPGRISRVLGCDAEPEAVVRASVRRLRDEDLPLHEGVTERLLTAARLVDERLTGDTEDDDPRAKDLWTPGLRRFVSSAEAPARLFPQEIFQWVLAEAGVPEWDGTNGDRRQTAMFHLGQFSGLLREVESPGWTSPGDFRKDMIALSQWGAQNARTEKDPLLVEPDAVTISTVHKAKGLEYPAVFLADVKWARFPRHDTSGPQLPYGSDVIDPDELGDTENYDENRRLMYVGLTRAERYLFMTSSEAGGERGSFWSPFMETLGELVAEVGGEDVGARPDGLSGIRMLPSKTSRDEELVTSFSELRYFLECPHDFYLRNVLGFAPGIDRALGYGEGVHNLLRSIHSSPEAWAEMAEDREVVRELLKELADEGLFYLRYTTGDPAEDMRNRALEIVSRYVDEHAPELAEMEFEPEREFETLVDGENVLVTGAIDLLRFAEPPRVNVVDFKSGQASSVGPKTLARELMELQVKIYGLAAKTELEHETEQGLVRYLGEEEPDARELEVPLDDDELEEAREVVMDAARRIRGREFHSGPSGRGDVTDRLDRCGACDFIEFCGLEPAREYRDSRTGSE